LIDMLFAIALGGATGTLLRYAVGMLLAPATLRFPLATLLINVSGSFLIGWFAEYPGLVNPTLRVGLIVGLCGGFTTFSAFSLETMRLIERGEIARAALYASASVVLCICATALGLAAARASVR
jgi:CrcB protein